MKTFNVAVVEFSLDRLWKQKYFDITYVDKIAEALGLFEADYTVGCTPFRLLKEYKALAALHCIDFTVMPPELLEQLKTEVYKLLKLDKHGCPTKNS